MIQYNLRKIRQAKNLTQGELAIMSGVPQSTISDIELGKVDAKISTLKALAEILEITIDELVKY